MEDIFHGSKWNELLLALPKNLKKIVESRVEMELLARVFNSSGIKRNSTWT